uniref:Uncharacterized protein n=1 Tax=Timema poppense TaxID=170557 RepID=A0A7R9DRM0_TIMPO|nr:unnamed protein product [Timema poppensis]
MCYSRNKLLVTGRSWLNPGLFLSPIRFLSRARPLPCADSLLSSSSSMRGEDLERPLSDYLGREEGVLLRQPLSLEHRKPSHRSSCEGEDLGIVEMLDDAFSRTIWAGEGNAAKAASPFRETS